MNKKTQFQDTAARIFDTFGDLIIQATYIKGSSSYVPGGNNTVSETEYSIRLIRDSRRAELTLATDIPRDAKKYMLVTRELPVAAEVKDKIRIGTETESILAVDADPADAVTMIWVG